MSQEPNSDNYSAKQYSKDFLADKNVNEKALERAFDIRKFEIDLYWKRATYFWTFIAATLAGFVAVQTSSDALIRTDMSILLAGFGIVFSFGWFFVNRASKFWQENWEFQVDMLEDKINGPLYKVALRSPDPVGFKEKFRHYLVGSTKISVSKINQLISLFVLIIWVGLLFYSLPPFRSNVPIDYGYSALIVLTAVTCFGIWKLGRKTTDDHSCVATIRSTTIKSAVPSDDT